MEKADLKRLLDAETDHWSAKTYDTLAEELPDIVAYERGDGDAFHQFEVQMIERAPDCLHILLSIDDGCFIRSLAPLTRSFIVYRDGRVEK